MCIYFKMLCVYISCIVRAFDTLAKVLHSGDGSAADSLEATMQLMSGDQSGPVVELEGPLLSDSHIPFKVNEQPLNLTLRMKSNQRLKPPAHVLQSETHFWLTLWSHFLMCSPAYDAFACARVPQCQLHL